MTRAQPGTRLFAMSNRLANCMYVILRRMRLAVVFAIIATAVASAQPGQIAGQMDEYIRVDLSDPATSTFRVAYEVSVSTAGATTYVDPVSAQSVITHVKATDVMTGNDLIVVKGPGKLTVTLARPVPKNGLGRIRIEKTVRDPKLFNGTLTLSPRSRRGVVVLPTAYELTYCNLPVQVLQESDGRIAVSFMNQAPGPSLGTFIVKMRGPTSAMNIPPTPLTNSRSWEPPPAQGPTERARLTQRALGDRDITYFLQEPSTNSFSLFHDYTESRVGVDKYINVVRTGSAVSNPSALILDTGDVLRHETLKGQAITDAKIDTGGPVTADTEIVVSYFPPVKAGQSVRLRITETYTAPQSYRLDGSDLVFDRSLGRPRNSVVLPPAWYLTSSSIPAVISETPDKLIRLDFFNGRNDGIDVLIKARKR